MIDPNDRWMVGNDGVCRVIVASMPPHCRHDCVAACVPDSNEGQGNQIIKLNIIRFSAHVPPLEVSTTIHTQVTALKKTIWELVDIAPHRQQLVFGTSVLENLLTLGESGIKDGSDLTLVQHLDEECYRTELCLYISVSGLRALQLKAHLQGGREQDRVFRYEFFSYEEVTSDDVLDKLSLFMRMPDHTLMMPLCMCSNFDMWVDDCKFEVDMKLYTHVNEMVEQFGVRGTAAALLIAHILDDDAIPYMRYGIPDAMQLPILSVREIKSKVFGSAS